MMRVRLADEPAEIVIWVCSGLLATVLGLGVAFFLWAGLRLAEAQPAADVAVSALGLGISLLGIALGRPLTRVALILFSISLVTFFIIGDAIFGALV